jgi:hypothetical protein
MGQLADSFKRITSEPNFVAESVEVMSAGCGSAKFVCTMDNREKVSEFKAHAPLVNKREIDDMKNMLLSVDYD